MFQLKAKHVSTEQYKIGKRPSDYSLSVLTVCSDLRVIATNNIYVYLILLFRTLWCMMWALER